MDAEQKLIAHIELGDRVRLLIEEPAVQRFFADEREERVRKMIAAPVEDDATRRAAAIEIAALDRLQKHLTDCVVRGRRSSEALDKMRLKNA